MSPLDPRTLLLSLVVVNATVLGTGPFPLTIAAAALTLLALAWTRPGWAVRFALAFSLSAGIFLALPALWPGAAAAAIALVAFWLARFAVAIGWGAFVISQLRPAQLTAALRRMHTPEWLTIPIAVVVRFLPVLAEEAKAIVEAMTLRGLRPGAVGVLAHPLRYGQYVLLPLVSSAVRIGDELSASALIRGLGGPSGAPAPSSATALRFTVADALLLLCLAGLLVLRFVSPEVRP